MPGRGNIELELAALRAGSAFADMSDRWLFEVAGADAEKWLNDLVTAGVAELPPGRSAGSLLLDPTGHIRAHFLVVRTPNAFVLLQDPRQPIPVGKLLAKYVLSSAVTIAELTGEFAVFEAQGHLPLPADPDWSAEAQDAAAVQLEWTLAATRGQHGRVHMELAEARTPVGEEALEIDRIRRGIPRFPVDLTTGSIPAEATGCESMVDGQKGCFLGQESVAKARLGHPPYLVLGPFWIDATIRVDEPILDDGRSAGSVTSATKGPEGGTLVIARIRWRSVRKPLSTSAGHELTWRGNPVT